jgi:hypothetical protein
MMAAFPRSSALPCSAKSVKKRPNEAAKETYNSMHT